jgi:hypothetical protein
MKSVKKAMAILLAAICVLSCLTVCLFVFAEDGETEHTHNYVPVTVIRPTCTEEGLIRYICSCGAVDESQDTPIAATGHRWGPWTTIEEATTEREGLKERTCINDPSHKEYKTIEKVQPSEFSQFFQNIIARFKALFDRIFSLFYRD